ncbi:unnamed protein product [Closterium sp. NIES-53]
MFLDQLLDSRDVTFDESMSYLVRYPHRCLLVPPPPLFLTPTPSPCPAPPVRPPHPDPATSAMDSGGADAGGASAGGAGSGGAGAGSDGTEMLVLGVLELEVLELEVLSLGVLKLEVLALEVLVLGASASVAAGAAAATEAVGVATVAAAAVAVAAPTAVAAAAETAVTPATTVTAAIATAVVATYSAPTRSPPRSWPSPRVIQSPLTSLLFPKGSSLVSCLGNLVYFPVDRPSSFSTSVGPPEPSFLLLLLPLTFAATYLVATPPTSPQSAGGEYALGSDVLEDRQFELKFRVVASPHLCAVLLAPGGDPGAPHIPTPRTYTEAVSGQWAFQRITAMDAKMV